LSGSEHEEANTTEVQAALTSRLAFSESESEDEGRVVKSAKDKRWEAMQNAIKPMKNHLKISDWQSVSKDFENLQKLFETAKTIVKKEGVPIFYLKALAELISAIKPAWENKKSFSGANSKALVTLRKNVTKAIAPVQAEVDTLVASLNDEEKQASISSESSDSGSSSDSDSSSESSDSDSDSDSDNSESSESSDSEDHSDKSSTDEAWSDDSSDNSDADIDETPNMFSREFWVKKVGSETMSHDEKERERELRRRRNEHHRQEKLKRQATEASADIHKGQDDRPMTQEQVIKRLQELLSSRGKRSTDRVKMAEDLQHLARKATVSILLLKIRLFLAAALFDITQNTGAVMSADRWREAANVILDVMRQYVALSPHRAGSIAVVQTPG